MRSQPRGVRLMRGWIAFAAFGAFGVACLAYAVYSSVALHTRLQRAEAALNRALVTQHELEARLQVAESRPATDAEAACNCDDGDVAASETIVIAPDGTRLASPEARTAYFRSHLERRMEASFPPDRFDAATREAIVDLLVEIRALRTSETRVAVNDPRPSVERDAMIQAQEELSALTGMGVGELLHELDGGEAGTSTTPRQAVPPLDGEERKRFPDEIARILGVTEPGSVEVMQDGEWEPKP